MKNNLSDYCTNYNLTEKRLVEELLLDIAHPLDVRTPKFKPFRNEPELLEVFKNELSKISGEKIKELKEAENRLSDAFEVRKKILESFPEFLGAEVHCLLGIYSLILEGKNIQKWKTYWQRLDPSAKKWKTISDNGHFSEAQIKQAKDYPIQDLLDTEFTTAGSGKLKANCPFHTEKNPSFIIYLNQNSCHCFSCQAHYGNAVSFLMEKNNISFPEAIRQLLL